MQQGDVVTGEVSTESIILKVPITENPEPWISIITGYTDKITSESTMPTPNSIQDLPAH